MRMGRKRRSNKTLPTRVYAHHGSYRFVPKSGPPIILAKIGDYGGMLRALGDVFGDHGPLTTMAKVFDKYELEVVPSKAETTQIGYRYMLKNLRQSFGAMQPRDLRQHHVAQYRDKRKIKAPTQANRELQLLSAVCSKAKEWGAIDVNPILGLAKVQTEARQRYVSDDEYIHARALASPMLGCVMDLALLTGLRRTDLLRLSRADLTEDGILIRPSKTRRTTKVTILIQWTPALRYVIKEALKIKPQVRQWLFCNRLGKPITKNGFDSAWQRLMDKVTAKGEYERFQFRDIRAKNVSDDEDIAVASDRLGHASQVITKRIYMRKARKVRPLR